jgi:predicted component of type VI protein secretion system
MKKVKLVVVQGKNEGKTITLPGPVFRIGRGETCHLRPNSERVSREHAEIRISESDVVVRDLGSRNGTLVNGKAITEPMALKDHDSVQVGPLTFSVSIADAPAAEARPVPLDPNQIPDGEASDSWQIADIMAPSAGGGGGDTVLIPAFTNPPAAGASDSNLAPVDASDEEYERYDDATGADPARKPARGSDAPKPKPSKSAKSGDAASDILRKIMSRRQRSK